MSVLITGGIGYIGSNVANLFFKNNIPVIILDNLSNSNIKSISTLSSYKFYYGDYGDKKLLKKIFKENNINVVIHLASNISVGESIQRPLKYYYNNYYKTIKLIKTMKKFNIENIIFASSAAIYGNNLSEVPIKENNILCPISPYGKSKKLCENLIQKSNMHYCNLRFFNVSGATEYMGESHINEFHIIPLLVSCYLNNQTFYINGQTFNSKDGTCVRDYVHVTDIANLIYKSYIYLIKNYKQSLTLNAGSGIGVSNLELIQKFAEMNYNISYEIKSERKGDPPFLIADISQAKEFLQWEPYNSNIYNIIKDNIYWGLNRYY